MLPHLSFFLHFFLTYFLPYLSFPLRIDPLRFQAGCRKRRLNLASVFCAYSVLWYISFDRRMRAFVVLVLVFPYQTKRLTWETSPKWPIFVEWDVKPQLSQSVNGQTWRHAENRKYITYRNTIIDYRAIPQPHVACTEKLAELGCMVSEISARTDRLTYCTLLCIISPSCGVGAN